MRKYRVSTINYKYKPEFRTPTVQIVKAHSVRDAYDQVDCLIDRTIQCNDIRVSNVEPVANLFTDWLNNNTGLILFIYIIVLLAHVITHS